jgi:hypothetical protein
VPVSESFAAQSPYTVHRAQPRERGAAARSEYWLRYDGVDVVPVDLSPRPGWYDRQRRPANR